MYETLAAGAGPAAYIMAGLLGLSIGLFCAKLVTRYIELLDAGLEVTAGTLRLAAVATVSSRGPRGGITSASGRASACRASTGGAQPGGAQPLARPVLLCCTTLMMALSLALYGRLNFGEAYWLLMVALALLLVLGAIDLYRSLLPDALTLPLLWFGLLVSCFGFGIDLHDSVLGAASGYAFLALVASCFQRLRGYSGMGGGDLKLLAAMGAWLGWRDLPMALLVACILGVAFAMCRQRTVLPRGAYPFGPFLAAAGVAVFALKTAVHSWF